MIIDAELSTNGKGLWSRSKTVVRCTKMTLHNYDNEWNCGELRVFFTKKTWDIDILGLIYTDPQWIKEFRQYLKMTFGFSPKACKDVDYSEQGMQGDNYVSLDIGKIFHKEFTK